MAFNAGAITSSIGIDVSPFAQGMLQAQTIASTFPRVVSSFLANPLLGVIETFKEAGAAGADFFGMVANQARSINFLGESAAKAGVSVEFLSGIGKAFENAGSSVDGLGESMKFLNRAISEVVDMAPGSERTALLFQQLGINYQFLRSHINDSEGVFYKVADAIASIQSPSERTRILMELLSRGGADAITSFSEGSRGLKAFAAEINKLGDVASEKQASISHSFVTLSSYLTSAFDGIERAASQPILEVLAAHFGDAQKGIEQFAAVLEGRVGSAISGAVNYLIDHAGEIKSTLKGIGDDIEKFIVSHGPEIKQDWMDIGAAIHALIPSIKEAGLEAQKAFAFAHTASDFVGKSIDQLTDPDQEISGGHPYAQSPNLTADAVSKAGDIGLANLLQAAKHFVDAQTPILDAISKTASGSLRLHADHSQGYDYSDKSQQNLASAEDLALRARASEMRLALYDFNKAQHSGGHPSPEIVANAVDRVKAFGDAIDHASRLIQGWQENLVAVGDEKTTAAFQSALASSHDAIGAARASLQQIFASQAADLYSGSAGGGVVADLLARRVEPSNPGNAFANLSAPALVQPIVASPPVAPLLDGFRSVAVPAAPAVHLPPDASRRSTGHAELIAAAASDAAGEFRLLSRVAMDLRTAFGGVTAAFAAQTSLVKGRALVSSVASQSPAAGAATEPSTTSASMRAAGLIIENVNVPPFDSNAASSQIAAKLAPIVRDAVQRQRRHLDATTQQMQTQAGL